MKLFGSDTNSGMIQEISDWFGMSFNPKLPPGYVLVESHFNIISIILILFLFENTSI